MGQTSVAPTKNQKIILINQNQSKIPQNQNQYLKLIISINHNNFIKSTLIDEVFSVLKKIRKKIQIKISLFMMVYFWLMSIWEKWKWLCKKIDCYLEISRCGITCRQRWILGFRYHSSGFDWFLFEFGIDMTMKFSVE